MFKVGEQYECVETRYASQDSLIAGRVYTVERVYDAFGRECVDFDLSGGWVIKHLVAEDILKPRTPPEATLKIGDLVECIDASMSQQLKPEHCYCVRGTYTQKGRPYITLHGVKSRSPWEGYLAERFKLFEDVHG